MKIKNIFFISVGLCFLALTSCASKPNFAVVSFKVIDKETNEEIKDALIHVQGAGVDSQIKPGETIELENASFKPTQYTADVEAPGYVPKSGYHLQRQTCRSCGKSFSTAPNQTIYMDKAGSLNPAVTSQE